MDRYVLTPIDAIMLLLYQKVETLAAVQKTEAEDE